MRKTTRYFVHFLAILTLAGCGGSFVSSEQAKSNKSSFCLLKAPTINGFEITRQYFKYSDDRDSDSDCSNYYLRIDNQVSYGEPAYEDEYNKEVDFVDLESFRVLSPAIALDNDAFYIRGRRTISNILDRNSFIIINSSYARDDQAVYGIVDHGIQILVGADPKTFQLLENDCEYYCHAKDKNGVYYQDKKLQEADPNSFKIVHFDKDYGVDKNHMYWNEQLVEGTDPNSFEKIDKNYSKDKTSIYYQEDYGPIIKIANSDSASFEFLKNDYAKDKNQVYFNGDIVMDADPNSFEVEDEEYFAKDARNLYVGTQKRDKKSMIKNYIEAYFSTVESSIYFGSRNVDVSKNNKDLNIVLQFNGVDYSPFWFFAEGSCPLYYLPRKDEEILRGLENKLRNIFDIEKITVSYRNYENKIVEVYSNHQYVYEDIFLGLSQDGRYAELSFDFDGLRNDFGLLYDMQTGKNIGYSGDREKRIYCGGSNGCGPEWSKEGCKEKNENDKKEFLIKPVSNFEDIYFKNAVELNESIRVISKEVDYPKGSKNTEGYELEGYENMININLIHNSTHIETTIVTIDEPKCGLDSIGFYGNMNMKGLIFLYVDGGCYWQNPNTQIISQSLLDQKLAELYNNVGMHYYDEKDHQKAVEYFDKALEIKKDYAQAYYNKACVQSLMGNDEEAISSLRRAIELEPAKFGAKARKDADFDSIRNKPDFIGLLK